MQERLYRVKGTGWFFHDFYVMASSPEFARARATDILFAEHRARSGKWARKSALEQIRSITEVVPQDIEIVIIF